MYKTSKMKYLQIIKKKNRNILDYRVPWNVPENSSKLRCLVTFQNRPGAPIGRYENFEFLEGQFCKEKPSFVD